MNHCLTFDDYNMPAMMICSRDDDSPVVTDYDDDLMYHFLALSMCFIVASLYVLTPHVTVCVCHAELKGFLLACFSVIDVWCGLGAV